MWDTIIFGKSKSRNQICSATLIFKLKDENGECKHGFSHNFEAYWISKCILNTDCTVYKDTPEGIRITKMIDEGKTSEKIYDYINKKILSKLPLKSIYSFIEREKEKSFEEGERARAKKIANALMLNRY